MNAKLKSLQEQIEQLKAMIGGRKEACPACGYCPHCGRSNWWYGSRPNWIGWPYTWTTTDSTTIPPNSDYTVTYGGTTFHLGKADS